MIEEIEMPEFVNIEGEEIADQQQQQRPQQQLQQQSQQQQQQQAIAQRLQSKKAQRLLLEVMREGNFENFRELLGENIDMNYRYGERKFTLLMEACWLEDRENFVELLLNEGADPNIRNNEGQPALHFAAWLSQERIIELLLRNDRIQVDATDSNGFSALHEVAKPCWDAVKIVSHKRCIQMLLNREEVQINRPNYFGSTALWLAAEQNHPDAREIVQELLRCAGVRHLEVDIPHAKFGKTLRQLIEEKFPSLKSLLPARRNHHTLMEILISPKPILDCFSSLIRPETVSSWFGDPYYCTYLEIACRRKDLDENFIKVLLENGADVQPTEVFQKNFCYPILHQAILNSNYKAVKILVIMKPECLSVHNRFEHTALHVAARMQCSLEEESDMKSCINLLLGVKEELRDIEAPSHQDGEQRPPPRIHVDAPDASGTTALLEAADGANASVALALLRAGANLMAGNSEGRRPLDALDATTLRAFLDEQLASNHRSPRSKDFKVIMRYTFLFITESEYEMETIYKISRSSELRHLLQHPIIKSFLEMKWFLVKEYIIYHLIIYVLFTIFFTAKILFVNMNIFSASDLLKPINSFEVNSNDSSLAMKLESGELSENFTYNYRHELSVYAFGISVQKICNFILLVICNVLLMLIAFYEMLQCSVHWKRYINDWENIFEIFTIIMGYVALNRDSYGEQFDLHVSAIAILLVWFELVLFTGRMPILSIQLEMLRKVSYTFIKFMAWYSLLVVAFGLSFFILFGGRNGNDLEDNKEFLRNPLVTILRTIIMMVGELNASDLVFRKVPVTSHIIFLIFVLLIVIVLLNLLNGLAVSDTQVIQDDAKVLSLVSLVKLMSYWEMMILSIVLVYFPETFSRKYFQPFLRVFKSNQSEKKIELIRRTRKVKYPSWKTGNHRIEKRFRMNDDIIKDMTDIIMDKKKMSENEELKLLINKLQEKLEKIEQFLGHGQLAA